MGFEVLGGVWSSEGVGFCASVEGLVVEIRQLRGNIQHVIVQTDMIWFGKDQIEIFQSLREPETLHLIFKLGLFIADVFDSRMAEFRACRSINILKHAPRRILKTLVSGNAVHDKDRLESLRSR